MNNYCRNCGFKLEEASNICPKCNVKVIENRINVEQKKLEIKELNKKDHEYTTIIICIYLLSLIITLLEINISTFIVPLLELANTIFILFVRFKFKHNNGFEIFYNIILIYSLISLLSSSIFNIACDVISKVF